MDAYEQQTREQLAKLVAEGQPLTERYLSLLYPNAAIVKGEYELVYRGKMDERQVIADTLAAPLQPVRIMPAGGATYPNHPDWSNRLIFGDNLQVLKALATPNLPNNLYGQVDLIYIDPPFSTKQDMEGGQGQQAYSDKVAGSQFIEFLRRRLIFLSALLKPTGSIYVHLDYRMVGPAKVLMDEVFNKSNFQNQVVWAYGTTARGAKAIASQFARNHDYLVWYRKGSQAKFHGDYYERLYTFEEARQKGFQQDAAGVWFKTAPRGDYTDESIEQLRVQGRIHENSKGNIRIRYNLSAKGDKVVERLAAGDVWTDIADAMHMPDAEQTGYPTQKPEALLARIIRASSDEGDVVLDAFAGSGTTAAVAERLGRRWVAIDCGKFAIYTIQKRLLKGSKEQPVPHRFTLYNAGLYDMDALMKLDSAQYRRFVLQLFQASEHATPKRFGDLEIHGQLGRFPVHVYDFQRYAGLMLGEQTIESMHQIANGSPGERLYIIAPDDLVDFFQDYVEVEDTRYYVLRVPRSILDQLRRGNYQRLRQPSSQADINDPATATGFDFIHLPELEASYELRPTSQPMFAEYTIRLQHFATSAAERNQPQPTAENRFPTFAMLLVDPDYAGEGQPFRYGYHFYADAMRKSNYTASFLPREGEVGEKLMFIYIDIYGNEYTELRQRSDFQPARIEAAEETIEAIA